MRPSFTEFIYTQTNKLWFWDGSTYIFKFSYLIFSWAGEVLSCFPSLMRLGITRPKHHKRWIEILPSSCGEEVPYLPSPRGEVHIVILSLSSRVRMGLFSHILKRITIIPLLMRWRIAIQSLSLIINNKAHICPPREGKNNYTSPVREVRYGNSL